MNSPHLLLPHLLVQLQTIAGLQLELSWLQAMPGLNTADTASFLFQLDFPEYRYNPVQYISQNNYHSNIPKQLLLY